MFTTKTRNFYTIVIAVLFMVIAAASSVKKIHCGAFSYNNTGEDRNEARDYVEKNDGTRIYGKSISWKTGLIVKDQIKIDDQKFRIKETRGYFSHGHYFGRAGSTYAERIVHGKLNVYYTEDMVTSTSTSSTGAMRMTTRNVCIHYVQIGDDGELTPIAGQKDIKRYVQSCPKAVEMIDKSNSRIRKAIRRNRNYLNEIFIIYNNGCQ